MGFDKASKLHPDLTMSADLTDFAKRSTAHRLTDETGKPSRVWPVWAYDITDQVMGFNVTRRIQVESLC